jgi:acyl-CoA synthetase (AMP-forming)/AMP-acid ligase II
MIRTDLIAPLGTMLERQATQRPQALAFRDKTRSVSYGELAPRTAGIASYLAYLGVSEGERVAIYLPNSVDWVEICLAIIRADAVAVPISFGSTTDEISYRLADAECAAVVTRPECTDMIAALCSEHGLDCKIVTFADGDGAPFAENLPTAPRDPEDIEKPAFIVYTSGTTGNAKGVVLSMHGLLWVTASCWAPIAGLNENDYVLNALPLYHSYALSLAVVTIVATGASEYIMEQFSTSQIITLLSEQPFTVLPGVPTMFHYLLDKARQDDRRTLGQIRICLSAGAVLPGTLNQQFEAWFGVKLLDGYGITETSTMVTINWPEGGRRLGSCGLPVPGLAVRIIDLEGRDVAFGTIGELIVRGPNVMLGYHNKPQETAHALAGGWYRTGDLARSDRDGFLTITGRLKEVIIRGGQNISPAEVEEAISTFAAVLDCAVVGMAHEFLGEVPVAFVIVREGHDIEITAVIAHCRELLSAYKVPDSIHVVDAIPRTGSGKVQRFKLKKLLEPA